MNMTTSDRLVSIGRWFFGIALIAWGVQQLVAGDFVTRVVPWWPARIPARSFWAYLIGALLLVAGLAILLNLKARVAALAFAVFALLSFLLLGLPLVINDTLLGAKWTSTGKLLVMCGGAVCVAVSLLDTGRDGPGRLFTSPGARTGWLYFGRVCLGAFMILAGIQHFMFVKYVVLLLPAFIPGAVFWVYFAGVALIAGGVGIITPLLPRLAALLSGVMIFSWVFLVHLPLVIKHPHEPGQVSAVFEALAFSGIAFLIAGLKGRRVDVRRWPR